MKNSLRPEDYTFLRQHLGMRDDEDPQWHPQFDEAMTALIAHLKAAAERQYAEAAALGALAEFIRRNSAKTLRELYDRHGVDSIAELHALGVR